MPKPEATLPIFPSSQEPSAGKVPASQAVTEASAGLSVAAGELDR